MSQIKKLTSCKIDRKTWLRGEGADRSWLLRQDGKMCCLGQMAIQAGFTSAQINGVRSPKDLNWKQMEGDYTGNGNTVNKLMGVNDDSTITNKDREKMIIKLAARKRIKVKFVN
jgi:hypothetical protein